MNLFAERQLLIEPSKFSYKMWKEMPVSMYQSFTFFNLTNWAQVKSMGQKPRFVEVGPYVYKTIWTKSEIQFLDDESQVSFAERKQWHFQAHLSRGHEEDQIWTINTPLMTALVLIQNAPVITRNIVSVILDGLGEGAFIRRPIRALLFEGYNDLIVSVGPLFDRRFANFNGKFAYLYNKNDSIDGHWTVETGKRDMSSLNKISRFQSTIVNMTNSQIGQAPQGLNEVKPECAPAWALDQATNGQLFAPFNLELALAKQLELANGAQHQHDRRSTTTASLASQTPPQAQQPIISKRNSFFSRGSSVNNQQSINNNITSPASSSPTQAQASANSQQHDISARDLTHHNHQLLSMDASLLPSAGSMMSHNTQSSTARFQSPLNHQTAAHDQKPKAGLLFPDLSKFIFYPDLCRPLHLIASSEQITTEQGIRAHRYTIDPRVFMNSTQMPTNKCYEMNPRPPLANALAATINSVTGANVAMPNLVTGASSPMFSMFSPLVASSHASAAAASSSPDSPAHSLGAGGPLAGVGVAGIFERSNHHHHHNHHHNHPSSFLNNALSSLANAGQAASPFAALGGGAQGASLIGAANGGMSPEANANGPLARLGRVRQLFSNIVSQRMSGAANAHLPFTGAFSGSSQANSGGPSARTDDTPASSFTSGFHAPALLRRNPFAAAPAPSPTAAALSREREAMEARQAAAAASSSDPQSAASTQLSSSLSQQQQQPPASESLAGQAAPPANPSPVPSLMLAPAPASPHASDRWITQFRFKWPRGVFSIGQCQLGAPIYASLPHFLDADEYYLEQIDGLKPNRSLHEFYIDIESALHSIPVGSKARLQLNVATPELRFRNIPNAMIPVLWQEVSFEIDKPVARMLYWSFTMSSKLYTLSAIVVSLGGLCLLVCSLLAACRSRRQRLAATDSISSATHKLKTKGRRSMTLGDQAHDQRDARRAGNSSSRPRHKDSEEAKRRPSKASSTSDYGGQGATRARHQEASLGGETNCSMSSIARSWNHTCAHRSQNNANNRAGASGQCNRSCSSMTSSETLRSSGELRQGALLNHGFCASASDNLHHPHTQIPMSSCSPKQPSSRASSQCELMATPANGQHQQTTPNGILNCNSSSSNNNNNNHASGCSGCLLACLRHQNHNSGSTLTAPSSCTHNYKQPCGSTDKMAQDPEPHNDGAGAQGSGHPRRDHHQ